MYLLLVSLKIWRTSIFQKTKDWLGRTDIFLWNSVATSETLSFLVSENSYFEYMIGILKGDVSVHLF